MRALTLGFLFTASLSLAACGASDRSKLVKSCIDDGNDKKVCTCMADKLEASLSEEAFAAVAASAANEGEDDLGALEGLSPMEQMSVGVNFMEAAISCGVEQED